MHPNLSIVLPCYNPPSGWEIQVLNAYKELAKIYNTEFVLVIVNDGSHQDISNAIKYLQNNTPYLKFIDNSNNAGKGSALRDGVAITTTPYIIYTDIDFPYSISSFCKIYDGLITDTIDIAVGVKDEAYYKQLPFLRKFISKTLRKAIGLSFRMPITDTQCGLKGFNNSGKEIFLKTTINRYLFDLEFIYSAYRTKNKLRIKSYPISLRPEVVFRRMNTKILYEESLNFIKIFFKTK